MLLRDILSAVVAVAAYFSYYGFADLRDRRWAYYVLGGVLAAWVGWCWRQEAMVEQRALKCFVGSLMLIEGAQQALFGMLRWQSPSGVDLGVQVLGETVYIALASLALAAVWTWRARLWPSLPPAR